MNKAVEPMITPMSPCCATVTDGTSREAIVTFDSALNNVDEFFTDSNGRQMMKRKKNPRASFKLHNKGQEQVSSNYYPVVAGKAQVKE